MDIDKTKAGDIIRFAHPNAGERKDRDLGEANLILNNLYQVLRIVVHAWNTEVFLTNMPKISFNSVMFDNIPMIEDSEQQAT